MSIRFSCSACGKSLKAPDEYVGKRVRCSGCSTVVEVPDAAGMKGAAPPEPTVFQQTHDDDEPVSFPVHEEEKEEIDMTAMVDIVFFLLIFFLVTSLHSLQASMEMPTPDPNQGDASAKVTVEALEANDDVVMVRIDKDDTVWVNDSEAPTRQEVISKVKDAKIGKGGGKGATSMVVMANGDCRHETVVMVLDAGADAGIENVKLANLNDND